ncbi:hypothetical protein [uncultured Halomonas sp.]|uniref:hypothetical protein n=1 Tax=uncultured Halomonas sp. TaxID=173971 RepID=UPI00262E85A9|nr:hypothetical protein [uncultured Halomonas sp.]
MLTIANPIAIVPSNINPDLDYRIECRAEKIEEVLMKSSVEHLRMRLAPCDRIRLDELVSELAYNLAEREIKETHA